MCKYKKKCITVYDKKLITGHRGNVLVWISFILEIIVLHLIYFRSYLFSSYTFILAI